MPGKIYASSPGTLLLTEEERRKAEALDKTDVIMSQKGTLAVWEGMYHSYAALPLVKEAEEGYCHMISYISA